MLDGRLRSLAADDEQAPAEGCLSGPALIEEADRLRWTVPRGVHDKMVEDIYRHSAALAQDHVRTPDDSARLRWQKQVDEILTSRWTGIPAMMLVFAVVLWITILGANKPSTTLATFLPLVIGVVLCGALARVWRWGG